MAGPSLKSENGCHCGSATANPGRTAAQSLAATRPGGAIAKPFTSSRDHIPGGASHVDSSWTGDELDLTVHALGQAVATKIGVEETKVRVRVMLPGMLAMFAKPIEAMLQKKGNILLEDKRD